MKKIFNSIFNKMIGSNYNKIVIIIWMILMISLLILLFIEPLLILIFIIFIILYLFTNVMFFYEYDDETLKNNILIPLKEKEIYTVNGLFEKTIVSYKLKYVRVKILLKCIPIFMFSNISRKNNSIEYIEKSIYNIYGKVGNGRVYPPKLDDNGWSNPGVFVDTTDLTEIKVNKEYLYKSNAKLSDIKHTINYNLKIFISNSEQK